MPRGVKNTTKSEEVSLPLITDMERAIAQNTAYMASGRFMCADVTLQFQFGGTLEEIQAQIAYLESHGWRCTLAPDAEARERKDTNRDRFEQEEQGNPPPRNGQRDYQAKDTRLVVPFGKYRGDRLDQIETHDPSYVDWLAENATMRDIKAAAQKIVSTRRRVSANEELPF